LTTTLSAAASPAPETPSSTGTLLTPVPASESTVTESAPPSAFSATVSMPPRSMVMLPRLRVSVARLPLAETPKSSDPAEPLN